MSQKAKQSENDMTFSILRGFRWVYIMKPHVLPENLLKMGQKQQRSGRTTEEGSIFSDYTVRLDRLFTGCLRPLLSTMRYATHLSATGRCVVLL